MIKNGVNFVLNKKLVSIDPKDNTMKIGSITIDESKSDDNKDKRSCIEADMLILGTGVIPNTDILEKIVTFDNDNFVKCDAYM